MISDKPTTATAEEIVRDARASFDDFLTKRAVVFPTIRQRMAKGGRMKAKLLRPLIYMALHHRRIIDKKYILFSDRFPELVAQFSRKETVLIGGPAELRLAMKLRLPFRFSGDLYAACPDVFTSKPGSLFPSATLRVIERWQAFFGRQANGSYLVTPTDTLPIGLMLAKIAARCASTRVVCVQHGLFNSDYNSDDIDGRNSNINLVYSAAQGREMLRRLPHALVETMGFPNETRMVTCEGKAPRVIVLVGTGALEVLDVYKRSLAIYRDLARMMTGCGYNVFYRPHPTERPEHYSGNELVVDTRPKGSLLGGEGKVFFGFTSTLLYEANLSGHLVVTLDDPLLPGYSIETIGLQLATRELHQSPRIVTEGWCERQRQKAVSGPMLRERFTGALDRASKLCDAR